MKQLCKVAKIIVFNNKEKNSKLKRNIHKHIHSLTKMNTNTFANITLDQLACQMNELYRMVSSLNECIYWWRPCSTLTY